MAQASTSTSSSQSTVPSSSWADSVCVGACADFFKSQPALFPWRGVILQYLILSAFVLLVLLYQSITRKIARSPEAPPAPKPEVKEKKVVPAKSASAAAAPKSPKSRVVKKAAAVVEERVAEPVASPKPRKVRKSTSPGAVAHAVAEIAPAPAPYVIPCQYLYILHTKCADSFIAAPKDEPRWPRRAQRARQRTNGTRTNDPLKDEAGTFQVEEKTTIQLSIGHL